MAGGVMASGHYLPSSSMDSSRHKSGEKGRVAFGGFFCFSWIFILTIHHQLFQLKFFTEKYQYLPNQATLIVLKEVLFWQLSHPFYIPCCLNVSNVDRANIAAYFPICQTWILSDGVKGISLQCRIQFPGFSSKHVWRP